MINLSIVTLSLTTHPPQLRNVICDLWTAPNGVSTVFRDMSETMILLLKNVFIFFLSLYALFQDISMFSTQSSSGTNKMIKEKVDEIVDNLDDTNDEHVPYRPPSFQDYSSDSAKALMAKYENKGSLTPQPESIR